MDAADTAFDLRESRKAGAVVLSLHGDLDIAAVEPLQARLDELHAARTPVILNLSELEFMDSSGMACIAQAVRQARESGWDLQVGRVLHTQVQRLIELVDGATLFWPNAR